VHRTSIRLEVETVRKYRYRIMCSNGGVVYYQNTNVSTMIISKVSSRWEKVHSDYFPDSIQEVDIVYSACQGNLISTGKTASEAINNLLVNIYGI
jgi:hypothetical protein